MPRVDITELDASSKGGRWVVSVPHGKVTYRYEILDRTTVHVFKLEDALAPTYVIKDGICSCPAALHSKQCKHVSTIRHESYG